MHSKNTTRSVLFLSWLALAVFLPGVSGQELVRRTPLIGQQAYLRASNAGPFNYFGFFSSVAISGETMVVSAWGEESAATGVNGLESDDTAPGAGAAYVFVRQGNSWVQQAYLKASNTETGDDFGRSVAISGDTIVIGADGEDSAARGVNGDQQNNDALESGAAYVFVRTGTNWTQQAYLKASNADADDFFGFSVAISGDTIVVGAEGEDSAANGVGGNQDDNSASRAGAAYVFVRENGQWRQQAYLKASNTDAGDDFGGKVAIYGNTIAVASDGEDSAAAGINGNQHDNSDFDTGAVYIFTRSGTLWTQQAYIKALNPWPDVDFGEGLALSENLLVVGAPREASSGTGVNPNPRDYNAPESGAAYIFVRTGSAWRQQAYLKASNAEAGDGFGRAVSVWGQTVAVGAWNEDSAGTSINQNREGNSAENAGAAYVFVSDGTAWTEQAYLKAFNSRRGSNFGAAVAGAGDTVAVGAYDDQGGSGSVYVFTGVGPVKLEPRPKKRVVVSWGPADRSYTPETAARVDRPWLSRFEGELRSDGDRREISVAPLGQSQFFRFSGQGYYYDEPAILPPPIANSAARVRGPRLSRDGLTLYYFTDALGHGELWTTTRTNLDAKWSPPVSLSAVNTAANESFPAISDDGLELLFSDWLLYVPPPNERPGGFGGGDLWAVRRRNERAPWENPFPLPASINTEFLETMPCLSADGLTLIFVSDRPGGVGMYVPNGYTADLWMSTRANAADTNGWSVPVNLGPTVNSTSSDSSPFLTRDGLALFFTSTRPSPSGHDGFENIWVSRRTSVAEPFGAPASLGEHFTSFYHLVDPCLSPDGKTLFFGSRGLQSNLMPFADIWQISVRSYPPLSISLQDAE